MLLTLSDRPEALAKLQKVLFAFPIFSYFDSADRLYEAVCEHRPTLLLLHLQEVGEDTLAALALTRRRLPHLKFLIMTAADPCVFPRELVQDGVVLPPRVARKTLLYYLFTLSPRTANSSADSLNIIVRGLYMDPLFCFINLYGAEMFEKFSRREAIILRFVAERHPNPVSIRDISVYCAPLGKTLPRASILRAARSINARCEEDELPTLLTYDSERDAFSILSPHAT